MTDGDGLVSSLDTSAWVWTDATRHTSATSTHTAAPHAQLTWEIRLTSARGPDDDGLAGVLARI